MSLGDFMNQWSNWFNVTLLRVIGGVGAPSGTAAKFLLDRMRSPEEIAEEWELVIARVSSQTGPGSGVLKAFVRWQGNQIIEFLYGEENEITSHPTPYVDWHR